MPKPAGIRLGGQNGNARIVFSGKRPILVIHRGIKTNCYLFIWIDEVLEKLVARTVCHVKRSEATRLPKILQPLEIILVLFEGPAAIFVFNLRQNNRTSVLCQKWFGNLCNGGKILFRLGEIARIGRADFHVLRK